MLVVDDDEAFRNGLGTNLVDDGHSVHHYEHPRLVTPDRLTATDVLLTDLDMGDIDGMTFADGVHRAHPELPVVLITAYWSAELEAGVAARPFLHLCRKPVDYDTVHARVHELARGG